MPTATATPARIHLLAAQADALAPWIGKFTTAELDAWLHDQLGAANALDAWITRGGILSRAVPLTPVLHIISGNTPHAGFQSLFRGLLLGGAQRVKLPANGLPELENWISNLPPPLAGLIETSHTLPQAWRDSPAAVIFGDAETIAFFRQWCSPDTRRIEHGPKLSAAILFTEPDESTLASLAGDILREDQRGCLSVQNILADAATIGVRQLAQRLADALAHARLAFPRPEPTLSDSGRIRNFREILRYRSANGEPITLIESPGNTTWTVVLDATPGAPLLTPTPGGGTVIIRPIAPAQLTPAALGPDAAFLSTIVAHPFEDPATTAKLDALSPPRICAPGMAQFPTLFWSHDGTRPLADLVRWRDIG